LPAAARASPRARSSAASAAAPSRSPPRPLPPPPPPARAGAGAAWAAATATTAGGEEAGGPRELCRGRRPSPGGRAGDAGPEMEGDAECLRLERGSRARLRLKLRLRLRLRLRFGPHPKLARAKPVQRSGGPATLVFDSRLRRGPCCSHRQSKKGGFVAVAKDCSSKLTASILLFRVLSVQNQKHLVNHSRGHSLSLSRAIVLFTEAKKGGRKSSRIQLLFIATLYI
jgi:hypothetical protein